MYSKLLPARVSSPGKIIKRELDARGWTQRDLADIVGRPTQAINQIMKGVKQITPETAIELAEAFGTTPETWMNLEVKYRLWLAMHSANEKQIVRKSELYMRFPIRALQRQGIINPSDSIDEVEQRLCALNIKSFEKVAPDNKTRNKDTVPSYANRKLEGYVLGEGDIGRFHNISTHFPMNFQYTPDVDRMPTHWGDSSIKGEYLSNNTLRSFTDQPHAAAA